MSAPSEVRVEVQAPWRSPDVPGDSRLDAWAGAVLDGRRDRCELTIRIVGEAESRRLNRDYRNVDRPTNVLSFPCDLPTDVDGGGDLLGDLVICAPVVEREADEQGRSRESHYAHMVIHGVLHLLGYDHQAEDEAQAMETLESSILGRLGYPDPYCVVDGP